MGSYLNCKSHGECICPEDDFLEDGEFHDEVFNTSIEENTGVHEDRSAMRPNLELARKLGTHYVNILGT